MPLSESWRAAIWVDVSPKTPPLKTVRLGNRFCRLGAANVVKESPHHATLDESTAGGPAVGAGAGAGAGDGTAGGAEGEGAGEGAGATPAVSAPEVPPPPPPHALTTTEPAQM